MRVQRRFRVLQKVEHAMHPCAQSCPCLTQGVLFLCLISPTAVNRDDSSSNTAGSQANKILLFLRLKLLLRNCRKRWCIFISHRHLLRLCKPSGAGGISAGADGSFPAISIPETLICFLQSLNIKGCSSAAPRSAPIWATQAQPIALGKGKGNARITPDSAWIPTLPHLTAEPWLPEHRFLWADIITAAIKLLNLNK